MEMKQVSTFKLIAFSLLATLVFFVALELVLWLVGGVETRWTSPRGSGTGAKTLICAGDSVTFGLGADTEDSYPAQLARLSGLRTRSIHVVNLGKPGQDIDGAVQDVATYLSTHALETPTVVLLAGFNDCVHLPGLFNAPVDTPESHPVRDLLRHLRTYRVLRNLLGHIRTNESPPFMPPLPGTGHDVDLCREELGAQGLEQALALSKTHPFRLLVTTYPIPIEAPHSDLPAVTKTVNALLREETRRLGIPLLDTVSCIQAAERRAEQPFYNDDGIHLFAIGYGAMARCIAAELKPYLDSRG